MIKIIVDEMTMGDRLDLFLTESLSEYSRSFIQSLIQEGHVLVNNGIEKSNYRVKEGDEIKVAFPKQTLELKPMNLALDVVYEDEDFMIVNKEKGMVVHPSETTLDRPTLVHALLAYTNHLSDINGPLRAGIVHRLDKDTSGLLIIAKNNKTHEYFSELFQNSEITREYLALVHHEFEHTQALVDAPIGRDPKNRQKMTVTHINARTAQTKLTLLEKFNDYSLLKCELLTGRTHQIRVHCQYIKHPIVGDPLYSYKNTPDTKGQCLHAYRLSFKHPITSKEMVFEKEVPLEFQKALEMVRG